MKDKKLRKALGKVGIMNFEKTWPSDPAEHYTGPMPFQINELNKEVQELQKQVELLARFAGVEFREGNFLKIIMKKPSEPSIFTPDEEKPPRTTII